MKEVHCDYCKKVFRPGEFMAVLATFPTKNVVGRTDVIIRQWIKKAGGTVYCKECFENK